MISSILRRPSWRGLIAAAALLAANVSAHAIQVVDGQAQAGGVASVGFAYDFGTLTQVSALEFDLSFNLAQLQPVAHGISETFLGAPVDLDVALATAGTYFGPLVSASGISATWYAFDSNFLPLPPLQLSGIGTISFKFLIDPQVAAATVLPVSLDLSLFDENGDSLPTLSATANIITLPVPEPASWCLALAGLLAVGGAVQRSQARSDA